MSTESPDIIRQDLNRYLNQIKEARTKALADEEFDLGNLDQKIIALCERIEKLPPSEAKSFGDDLQMIIDQLNQLETAVKTTHDA